MLSHTDLLEKVESHAGISNTVSLWPSEREVARDLIRATEAQIAKSDTQMAVELRRRLERLRVATAPHKLLPPEIIIKILLQTLKGKGIAIPPNFYSNAPPWTLRRVCAPWRKITLGEPKLWNHFYLSETINNMSLPEARTFFQFLCKEILHPSGPILIEGTYEMSPGIASVMLSEVIMPNTHRLSALLLITQCGLDPDDFLHMPGSLFGMLEDLTILSNSPSTILSASKSPPFFDGLKSLRHLSIELHIPSNGGVCLPPNIPWHQLTSIVLVSDKCVMLNMTDAITILRQCSALVKLRIELKVQHEEFHSHLATNIHLPLLRELALFHTDSDSGGTHIGPLLDSLYVPAITHLELSAGYSSDAQLCAALISLIARSSCDFKDITIYDGRRDLQNSALETLLGLCSNLQTLFTNELFYADNILSSILSGDMLPMLESWQFHSGIESVNRFEEIIKARQAKTPALRYAKMYISRSDHSDLSVYNTRLEGYGAAFEVLNW